MASSFVNPLSQTVPQALLIQISTLPSAEVDPPTSLSSPLVQLAAKVEISVQKNTQLIIHIHRNMCMEFIQPDSPMKA